MSVLAPGMSGFRARILSRGNWSAKDSFESNLPS